MTEPFTVKNIQQRKKEKTGNLVFPNMIFFLFYQYWEIIKISRSYMNFYRSSNTS